MSIAKLIKWGNSAGIRIPAPDMRAANAHIGEEFKITSNPDGGFVFTPVKNHHQQWLEAFNSAADAKHDKMLINDTANNFDQDEWQW